MWCASSACFKHWTPFMMSWHCGFISRWWRLQFFQAVVWYILSVSSGAFRTNGFVFAHLAQYPRSTA
jgi:hypothetical protein